MTEWMMEREARWKCQMERDDWMSDCPSWQCHMSMCESGWHMFIDRQKPNDHNMYQYSDQWLMQYHIV